MSVLSRHVLRRLLARLALFLAIFLGVLVGGQLAALIGRGAPPAALGTIAGIMVLLSLPMALPMAMASAVLATFGEMRRDGELRALAAAGIDPLRAVRAAWPVVLGGMLVGALLWHAVLPWAMGNFRGQMAGMVRAMIPTKVGAMEPILSEDDITVWAAEEEEGTLQDLFVVRWTIDQRDRALVTTTAFAPRATWGVVPGGLRFELEDLQVVYRKSQGELAVGSASLWSSTIDPLTTIKGHKKKVEPDALSTRRVFRIVVDELDKQATGRYRGAEDRSQYNNARLTLHLRFYMPFGLLFLCMFAAGVAVAFGAAESLLAVLVVAAAAVLSVYPTIGYVKSNSDRTQIDPGVLLWLPGLGLAVLGWWMMRRPDSAREALAAPLGYLRQRVWRPLVARVRRLRRRP
jgi:lipopolysaccharide export LptBFGC system permease protein LptF